MSEVDDILSQIELEEKKSGVEIVPKESSTKDLTVVNFNGNEISVEDDDAMIAAVFASALDDKGKADSLYRTMEDRIIFEKDRSPEAKTVLSDAVNHRINATANLIKILELRKKYSAKAAQGNSLVNVQLSPRESGINIKNLADEILNG